MYKSPLNMSLILHQQGTARLQEQRGTVRMASYGLEAKQVLLKQVLNRNDPMRSKSSAGAVPQHLGEQACC